MGLSRNVCEHSVVSSFAVTAAIDNSFRQIYLARAGISTKGRAMFLIVLIPLVLGAAGILAMKYEDPDRVVAKFSPFVDGNR